MEMLGIKTNPNVANMLIISILDQNVRDDAFSAIRSLYQTIRSPYSSIRKPYQVSSIPDGSEQYPHDHWHNFVNKIRNKTFLFGTFVSF
jgi:hypothetical protein